MPGGIRTGWEICQERGQLALWHLAANPVMKLFTPHRVGGLAHLVDQACPQEPPGPHETVPQQQAPPGRSATAILLEHRVGGQLVPVGDGSVGDSSPIILSRLKLHRPAKNPQCRAARLVVDSGIHALGWSRQQAIDYLLAHTATSVGGAASQVDRYIAVPGQSTAYMTGNLEIRRLRELAERRLGARFDLRRFHDRVLEDGAVSLGMLRRKIETWIAAGGS